jgi:type IV secretory pathway TrbL component
VAYAFMAANIFFAQVELKVVLPVSLLALGFVFWGPTRQMAGGVFSYALNVCFRFFIQAILASLIVRLAPILTPAIPPGSVFALAIEQAVIMVIAAFVLAYLFWKIPSVVSQHLAGTPTLSAGGALQTAAGLVGMATGTGLLLRAGGRAVQGLAARATAAGGGGTAGGGPRPQLPAPSRPGPPRVPATQALQATLRAGAQFLGHDHGAGGPHVSL